MQYNLFATQIPADVRWVQGDKISVDTSSVTGEGDPPEYSSATQKEFDVIYCSMKMLSGSAYCVVVATGASTKTGGLLKVKV